MISGTLKRGETMMYQTKVDTRHLPPDLQELVDTIITGVMALASRLNSNSDSNSLGGIYYCVWRLLP
jgi:hypothetical protein